MFAFVKGKVITISPTQVILETNSGIGFEVQISLNSYEAIKGKEDVRLWTYLQINGMDYSQTLYGFAEESEKSIFLLLVSVSGIGANTARLMLSAALPGEIQTAIVSENELFFKKIKGIGEKTAKRLILELKEKMLKLPLSGEGMSVNEIKENNSREDAIAALVALGYAKPLVQKALNDILKSNPTHTDVQQLIRMGLAKLSS